MGDRTARIRYVFRVIVVSREEKLMGVVKHCCVYRPSVTAASLARNVLALVSAQLNEIV